MKKITYLLALILVLLSTQYPEAQTVPAACMNTCMGFYENTYSSTLGQYRQTVSDMLWDVVNETGNAWYGFFINFWQGVFQGAAGLSHYDTFRERLYTAEQTYYYRVGQAVTSFNQCLGGCTP